MATGTLALILLLATTPGVGDTFPMKERSLRIPIKVDPARRSQIKELRLFSSSVLSPSALISAIHSVSVLLLVPVLRGINSDMVSARSPTTW